MVLNIEDIILIGAGALGGAMNAMAGGGSFVTLPALIGAGVPSVAANASSTVALYPGGLASAWVYRGGLGRIAGVSMRPVLAATLAGGLVGALLLLWTPGLLFDRVLPWLLLVATLALAFGRRVGPALRARFQAGTATLLIIQFGLGIYGGYFGGAVGLMMMAAWNLLVGADVKALNPARTLLVSAANTIAVLCFAISGIVHWRAALLVAVGAAAGGTLGAVLGKRLPAVLVQIATVLFAAAMTVTFFLRAYR
ncbi:sulfite exporter TauE/SafE family protein [Rhodopseudomonas palustris]|uniref:sulfite exporter TauE/SafE family protein n=1 Tax=Rhodopseudomonas palustris TaxID=1076 RepID=UPI0020CD108B|nr:sulfite exporter TauE/SafE family protein [Rhodopseudomonas palustris]MCP9627564.1 sulfite exporter TauE/SafE family protein [Rhodopseudomonas palustris]